MPREKTHAEKGYPNKGWARKARTAKRVSNHGKRENGIQMAMIRVWPCDYTWKG